MTKYDAGLLYAAGIARDGGISDTRMDLDARTIQYLRDEIVALRAHNEYLRRNLESMTAAAVVLFFVLVLVLVVVL